jgi:hypothetical protein
MAITTPAADGNGSATQRLLSLMAAFLCSLNAAGAGAGENYVACDCLAAATTSFSIVCDASLYPVDSQKNLTL